MKPLSSYSCNGQEPLSSSRYGRTAGCISRILRRILCFSSLASCPFDHFKEEEKESSGVGGSGTPGIVARLMGLESIPTEGSPSVGSRSSPQVRRRRIIPAYQELEDEHFFILSFEQSHIGSGKQIMGDKCEKKRDRRKESLQERNKENGGVNMDSKENNNNSDFQVENPRKVLCPSNNSCQSSETIKKITFETENDSENSSPNSVLEFAEFPTDQESACSGVDISRLTNLKLRRTLSEELENCGKSEEKSLMNNACGGQEKLNRLRNGQQNYAQNWDDILKLAAQETIKSSWVVDEISKNRHYFKEIGRDIASEILDQLLDELLM